MKKEVVQDPVSVLRGVVKRRSFLRSVGVIGAAVPASALLATRANAAPSKPTKGDVAILQFLLAAELIETDLWQQYNELGGVNGGNPAYIAALQNLDGDMPQYIADNTDDEMSHSAFLTAYLQSIGATPVNLDRFKTLPSSHATGARNVGRLTNLQALNVDLSWYTRYRGEGNPDLGATFTSPFNINNQPAIPLNNTDTPPDTTIPSPTDAFPGSSFTGAAARMQAIANTAGFHFAFIEQGGASLYTTMSLKATSLEVLRIIVSIGGAEVNHFSVWHDKAGNAVAQPLAGVADPVSKLSFPDLNSSPAGERVQTNLIMPEPCQFIRADLPACSLIRPSSTGLGGAVATIKSFTDDQLFLNQSPAFLSLLMDLANAADAAERLG